MGCEFGPDCVRNRNVFGDHEHILGRMKNIRQSQGPVNPFSDLKDGIIAEGKHFVERKGCIGQQDLAFKRTSELLNMFLERRESALDKGTLTQDFGSVKICLKGIQMDCVGHSINDYITHFKPRE